MRTILFLLLILVGFWSTGCQKSNSLDGDNSDKTDYFPLHVGDKWVYKASMDSVVKVSTIQGRDYFNVKTVFFNEDMKPYEYTSYYRKSEDGKVYLLMTYDSTEYVKYNFNVKVGDSWRYNENQEENSWVVTLSKNDMEAVINNQSIKNCLNFYYDLPEAVDDEHYIILAPGIGRIYAGSYAWGNCDTLQYAVIQNITYEINK